MSYYKRLLSTRKVLSFNSSSIGTLKRATFSFHQPTSTIRNLEFMIHPKNKEFLPGVIEFSGKRIPKSSSNISTRFLTFYFQITGQFLHSLRLLAKKSAMRKKVKQKKSTMMN
jgi:hypothetical protein